MESQRKRKQKDKSNGIGAQQTHKDERDNQKEKKPN